MGNISSDMGRITIVGLGCGDGRFVTREVWRILEEASSPIWLRTAAHPVVAELPCEWCSFDDVYEASADFQSVYAHIIETIVKEAGNSAEIIYAVPGDPHVGEATTGGIIKAATELGINVEVKRGLSFYEPTVAAVNLDGMDGVQVYDAITIAQHLHAPINPDAPLVLGQVFSPFLASELKLSLMAVYPPEHVVQLIHNAGGSDEAVEELVLHEIDRSTQIGNLTSLYVPPRATLSSLGNFADTVAILRSPNGCPWDREQTPQSLREDFIEELFEAIDALDRDDVNALRDELGDVLLHIVMQTQMATEAGDFTLADVVAGIDAKIKRRHPHVWGDAVVGSVSDLNATWADIKAQEKAERGETESKSILEHIPPSLPSLQRSQKIQGRARKVGFDWPSIEGVYDKLGEEIAELKEATEKDHQSEELGDVLFVIVNLAHWLGIDAETAMREANLKFVRRFQSMEGVMAERDVTFESLGSIDAIEAVWQEAKRLVG